MAGGRERAADPLLNKRLTVARRRFADWACLALLAIKLYAPM